MVTKTQINREIKANGGVLKRTKDETVMAIKYYADTYGAKANTIIACLLWSLGFEPDAAHDAAKRITTGNGRSIDARARSVV